MRSLSFVCFLLIVGIYRVNAQGGAIAYDTGSPVRAISYTDVQGSAYLLDNWKVAVLTTVSGKSYRDYKIKYNQLEDELYFLGSDGVTPMKFKEAIREFSLKISDESNFSVYRNGYPPFKTKDQNSYYEVLVDGKFQLLKKNNKTINQYKEYNSATTTKKIADNFEYYFFNGEHIVEASKDNKVLEAIFKDKYTAVKQHIQEKNLNLKKEADLKELVNLMN